ncbi:cytidine deaminase family protein [Streptomyces sp. NPDC101132]|uniref:cytidine deaminase family protein n=1 Tax=Streptomyces sp. NPDC101132 TaxID=3366110 RepID=UPI003809F1C1
MRGRPEAGAGCGRAPRTTEPPTTSVSTARASPLRGLPHRQCGAAAAGVRRAGRIVTAVNAYHFTGGPCAELVLIGSAAAQGAHELRTIVAVGDRDRGVVPPCGRCRQVLLDYFPALEVIVGHGDRTRAVPIADLLPETYVWADHQLDAG